MHGWNTLLASVLVVAAVGGCQNKEDAASAKKPPPAPVKLELATAVEGMAPRQLVVTGTVAAELRSEVTADVAGKVIGVMIERGQRVKMGEPVVRLDVRTAALSAREAQANLASARAQRKLAEEECKRAEELLGKGAITRSEYDRQTTQCTSALQQVSAAEARAAMISKSVADGLVRAPFAGVVAEKNVTPGEWVAPGRPLFTLVDSDPLKISLSVPEVAIGKIEEGQKVVLRAVAFPERTFKATITRLGAEIGRTRSLIVDATIEPNEQLVPGMFAEATITIGEDKRVIVPKDAVVLRGKRYHVFAVVAGEVEDRIVQLGPDPDPTKRSLVSGVKPGEKIVAKVTEQVVDGVRVAE